MKFLKPRFSHLLNQVVLTSLVALVILVSGGLSASATNSMNVDQLLDLMERNHVSTIERILPLLPDDLRSGFTLQYQGHGLQQASFEFPRAILYGMDGSFVMTFNGDKSQGKFNSLEILQFNQRTSNFELYSLDFPLKRNSAGHIVRPQRNPTACASCHGSPEPHPIWGRYNFWPGLFGSHDDKLTDEETGYFKTFMATRSSSARYRTLLPRDGSQDSPFSTEAVQTFSFRPNDQLGSLLAHWSARSFAQKLANSRVGIKYFLLMSPLMFQCSDQLTYDEQLKLDSKLKYVFETKGYNHLPFPKQNAFETGNIIYLFGMSVGAWGLTSEKEPLDPYFLDRFLLTMPNYVLGQLKATFLRAYPGLASMYVDAPFSVYLNNSRLVQTDIDRDIAKTNDTLGIGMSVASGASCDAQINLIRQEFLN